MIRQVTGEKGVVHVLQGGRGNEMLVGRLLIGGQMGVKGKARGHLVDR